MDPKGTAVAGLAIQPDVAPALLDDAVRHGESETGALSQFFGSEEGFEGAGLHFAIHAVACVAHEDLHVLSGFEIFGLADRVMSDAEIARLNGKPAASRHSVLRVDGQIDEHLLDLVRVGLHPSQIVLRQEGQLDILFNEAFEEAEEVADDVVEVDHFGAQHLAAAEGEQLTGEHGRAVGGLFDLGEPLAQILVAGIVQDDFDVAIDDGQQVIEVVGNASGELAHGLHFLGLHELFFEVLLTGDILRQDVQERDLAGMVADGASADEDLDYRAIATQPGAFDAIHGAAGEQGGAHGVKIAGKNLRHVANQQLRLGRGIVAEHFEHGEVHLQELSAEGAAADGVGRFFDQGAVAVFGEAEGPFGHHTLGEIESHTDDADDGAVGSEGGADVGLEVASVDFGIEGAGVAGERTEVSVAGRLNDFGGGEEVLDGPAGEIGDGDSGSFQSGAGERGEPAVQIGSPEERRHSLEEGEEG